MAQDTLTETTVALTEKDAPASGHALPVQELTTPGGIPFWHVEDHTLPLIALRFGIKGGGATQDPNGREGTAYLASALLDEGAGPHDSLAYQALLEDNAIRISFDNSHDALSGDLTILKDRLDLGTELLRLALNEPRFDRDALERVRGQTLAGLRRDLHDPEARATRLAAQTFFSGHEYANEVAGTLESVPMITRDDILAHHENTTSRDGLFVTVVGAVSEDQAAKMIDDAFGALPETGTLKAVEPIEVAAGAVGHDEDDIAQTVIRFALPGIDRNDPDFLTAFVMNHILGGGTFSSRLFIEVRQVRGLTYGVYSYLANRDRASMMAGGASTRPERAQETLDVIREVIAGLRDDGPTQEELDHAKDFLIGSYPLRFDSSQKIARQLLGMQLEDMPISYLSERADLIRAITVDDVKRVGERLLKPDLALAIVGKGLS